jgi:flavin-dependent dehydrogenase
MGPLDALPRPLAEPDSSSDEASYDVAIVGAGLAGSSAALQLATAGWRVLLLERDEFPRHKVCGEFLSPEVQQTLHALQLDQTVAALAPVPLCQAMITSARGRRLTVPLPGTAWGLSRYALDATLAQAAIACGACLQTGSTVLQCRQVDQSYQLLIRQREQQRSAVMARAVLMACGRHTGAALPPQTTSPPNSRRGWRRCVGIKIHYERVVMPPQTELFLVAGGYVGLNPVEGGRVNLCALLSYRAFAEAGGKVDAAIAALMRQNGALAERLAGAVPLPASACTVAPVDTARRAAPWDAVACIGDTAAMIPPLCGDGMAMALQAATLCAPLADEFLRGRRTLGSWQTCYTKEWHAAFDQRLRWGRMVQSGLGWPHVGDLLLALGQALPGLATYLVRATRGS